MNTPEMSRDETQEAIVPVKGVPSFELFLDDLAESPIPMQKSDESRDGLEVSTVNIEDSQRASRLDDEMDRTNHDVEGGESEEDRHRREEEESIALARALMAEEAMAVSYSMSVDYLRNNRDQFSEEDLAALQAAMDDDEPSDGRMDESDMSYEMMLRLGEHLGDVKTERWERIAHKKIDGLPTFAFSPDLAIGMDPNDCSVKCLVCQFGYEEGECLRRLPCGHCFHRDCIDQWLQTKDFCPYCRTPILEEESAK